jgi:ABC-type branched-subunit amino acid transport system permease subunit
MIHKNTVQHSLYAAIAILILALTGIFGNFATRTVIGESITSSTVFLIVTIGGVGYFMANRAQGLAAKVVNGLVASLIIGVALALVMLLESLVDLTFIFVNLKRFPLGAELLYGQELLPGVALFLAVTAALGALAGLLSGMSGRIQSTLVISLSVLAATGLLVNQVNGVITLPDSLAVALVFMLGYATSLPGVALRLSSGAISTPLLKTPAGGSAAVRLGVGFISGLIAGVVLLLAATSGGLAAGGWMLGAGDTPRILSLALENGVFFVLVFGILGIAGAVFAAAPANSHNGALYVPVVLVILGLVNEKRGLSVELALVIFLLLAVVTWFVPVLSQQASQQYAALKRPQQQRTRWLSSLFAVAVLLVLPIFVGQYITSVLDLVLMYIIMGIGLNVMIGYAGLLDLGYVAAFAIGAYTVGLLMTPSLVTCGGVHPSDIAPDQIQQVCTGVMTFWQAWPFAILASGTVGVLLGIPVLRLRGDYLAIVTLGFGEIIRLLALSNDLKPLLGAAQGISPIPTPVIDLRTFGINFNESLGNSISIYYLFIAGVMLAAFVVYRLGSTRLGRAWRSMRADEDVAQAMGIHLIRSKLLAFGISSAFAGMGGAVFGSWLQGIFPNSFTLMVSINVVSLIIIGGLGSIPGAVVGSLILIGLPEVLRELQDYRLLAFGALLVVAMLLKPEGLLPPPVRKLSELYYEHRAKHQPEASHE